MDFDPICAREANACGGCSELPALDEPCGATGRYVCDGTEAVTCEEGSVATCCAQPGPSFGAPDATGLQFAESCGPNRAIIGFEKVVGTTVRGLRIICAEIYLDTTQVNGAYAVQRRDVTSGTPYGSNTGAFPTYCNPTPAGLVAGIFGRAGSTVDAFGFACNEASVAQIGGSWSVVIAPAAQSIAYGGAGGSPFTFDCPAGSVASGIHGTAGASSIDAIGIECSAIEFGYSR